VVVEGVVWGIVEGIVEGVAGGVVVSGVVDCAKAAEEQRASVQIRVRSAKVGVFIPP
jgi:hypothetical protein